MTNYLKAKLRTRSFNGGKKLRSNSSPTVGYAASFWSLPANQFPRKSRIVHIANAQHGAFSAAHVKLQRTHQAAQV